MVKMFIYIQITPPRKIEIVNICHFQSFPRFWPTSRGVPTQYGSLTVQLDSEGESNGIWTRKFIISSSPVCNEYCSHLCLILHRKFNICLYLTSGFVRRSRSEHVPIHEMARPPRAAKRKCHHHTDVIGREVTTKSR